MVFHLLLAGFGLAGTGILMALARRDDLQRKTGMLVGAFSGPFCGAGLLVGGFFQPTTANIHSGYSFAPVLEWLLLASGGGLLGLAAGVALGSAAATRRAAVVAFVVLALASSGGWVVSGARHEIDCDDDVAFCSARYH